MRVVLDTNILLTSIPRNSKYRIIFDRFLLKQFTLVLSNEIVVINSDEFIKILRFAAE